MFDLKKLLQCFQNTAGYGWKCCEICRIKTFQLLYYLFKVCWGWFNGKYFEGKFSFKSTALLYMGLIKYYVITYRGERGQAKVLQRITIFRWGGGQVLQF